MKARKVKPMNDTPTASTATGSAASPFTANAQPVSEAAFQNLALNPAQNVVIEACAGSGKTWLLVARLLKLLLSGVPPAQIVAVTFTRKAAQEMKQRLGDMLDSLHHLPMTSATSATLATSATVETATKPAKAEQPIEPLASRPDSLGLVALAQPAHSAGAALFAALGLGSQADAYAKIHAAWQQCCAQGDWPSIVTFHEWFGEMRQNAPLSSLSNAGAALTDDESGFIAQAWQQFWQDTQTQPALLEAMRHSVAHLGLNGFESAANALLARRAEWLVYTHSLSAANALVNPAASRADLAQHAFDALLGAADTAALWAQVQGCLPAVQAIGLQYAHGKGKKAPERALLLEQALANVSQAGAKAPSAKTLARLAQALNRGFSTKEGTLLKQLSFADMHSALNRNFAGGVAGFEDTIAQLFSTLNQVTHHATLLAVSPIHAAILRCGGHLIDTYQALKQTQGVMDFGDLELDALQLLSQQAATGQGARHLLLDEFQDTNPVQWQALQAYMMPLLDEAAAGGQAASVFVVGDPKQSIYRFRRADPRLFTYVQRTLQTRYSAVLLKTQRTRRNAQSVNDWVNAVFAPAVVVGLAPPPLAVDADVLAAAQGNAAHLFSPQFTLSAQRGAAGALPLRVLPAADNNINVSGSPIGKQSECATDTDTEQDAEDEAQQVVRTLLAWKQRHPQAAWSDAMVLARKRQALTPIADALHALGIASTRADKGGFFALPEISDVMALLAALNNPADALALLTALRSPVFGIDDAQLSELLRCAAPQQPWLGVAALTAPWAQGVAAWLASWQALCSRLPMHDALDAMVHQGQWVRRFAAQCPAVAAHLAQLLQLSLAVDQGRYPSLPRFVQAVLALATSNQTAAQSTAKPDAVRLSTIHGAKGLEADCVVMVDLCARDKAQSKVKVLLDWPAELPAPSVFAVQLCDDSALTAAPPLAAALASQQAAIALEKDTLLYVAMTRAVSELWISATPMQNNTNSMYERLNRALPMATAQHAAPQDAAPLRAAAQPRASSVSANSLRPQYLLSPPKAVYTKPVASAAEQAAALRQTTGTVMHALLEQFLRQQHWASPQFVQATAQQHGLAHDTVLALLTQCQSLAKTLHLDALHGTQVQYLAVEQALHANQHTLRPDVVAYTAQGAWVLDFKLGFNPIAPAKHSLQAQNSPMNDALDFDADFATDRATDHAAEYAAQLSRYVQALESAQIGQVEAYILTLAGQCWALTQGQWTQAAPPWCNP
jgi:ATP-dependent helicase/nuclease subunit A